MVLQDNILFSESIATNIRMGNPEASDAEVRAAAQAANADEFITDLPYGYDTLVGERGVKLSGGQQQRVAIARVFLKNPPILIFDEATSALDLESEQSIQHAMENLASERTTFIVAHRLATITHADKIVVIEHGEIKEVGSHQELMRQQGSYYDLYQVQEFDQLPIILISLNYKNRIPGSRCFTHVGPGILMGSFHIRDSIASSATYIFIKKGIIRGTSISIVRDTMR